MQGLLSLSRLVLGRGHIVQLSAAASGHLAHIHRDAHQAPVQQPSSSSPSPAEHHAGACSSAPRTPSPSSRGMMHHGKWSRSLVPLAWEQLLQQRLMSTAPQQSEDHAGQSGPASGGSCSTSSGSQEEEPKAPPLSQDVVYEGPLSKTHKMLKLVSIGNTLIAFAAAPAIIYYTDISYISRVGLASSMVLFGILTTGALHWITNPYVHELKFHATTQQIDVRTTTLFGGNRWSSFNLSDVQPLPWNRPVATFIAKNRFYYIDVFSFPDEDLLKRLTPDESTVPQGHKDDDDD